LGFVFPKVLSLKKWLQAAVLHIHRSRFSQGNLTKFGVINNSYLPPPPSFSGKNYDFWAIKMRTRLHTEDLWDIVLNGFEEPSNQEAYETMIQDQKGSTHSK
jgi:hypothetical protein